MTYQKAIEDAKIAAYIFDENYVVYSYKNHWWQRRRFDYDIAVEFEACRHLIAVKLLTITPNGTIAQ